MSENQKDDQYYNSITQNTDPDMTSPYRPIASNSGATKQPKSGSSTETSCQLSMVPVQTTDEEGTSSSGATPTKKIRKQELPSSGINLDFSGFSSSATNLSPTNRTKKLYKKTSPMTKKLEDCLKEFGSHVDDISCQSNPDISKMRKYKETYDKSIRQLNEQRLLLKKKLFYREIRNPRRSRLFTFDELNDRSKGVEAVMAPLNSKINKDLFHLFVMNAVHKVWDESETVTFTLSEPDGELEDATKRVIRKIELSCNEFMKKNYPDQAR